MSIENYHVCQRCVMDTTDVHITFDETGNCNHCSSFLQSLQKYAYQPGISEKRWLEIVEDIKKRGRGKKYDCLVGVSGGVDSSYTAHLCKEYGLRPLLMHVDNGWDTEIAVKNITSLVEKLGFDYVSYVIDWKEFKEIQLAFLKSSIVDLEFPTDIAIAAANYQIASKYKIPTILSGGNYSSEGILPLTWGYHVSYDMKLYKHIVKTYGKVKLKKVPTVGLFGSFYYKFIKGIKTYYPLNYIPFNKDEARDLLMNNYGWRSYGGKHHESTITGFWQSYAMPTKYNFDYRKATYSSQICNQQLTRDEALKLLEALPYNEEKVVAEKSYIAKKFGISLDEFEGYLNDQPKTYLDFPNNQKRNEWIFNFYKKIKNKKTD